MDPQLLIQFLVWGFGLMGMGLIGALIWFAKRIVAQLDRLEKLFTEETHEIDLRLTRLEDWRETVSQQRSLGPRGVA